MSAAMPGREPASWRNGGVLVVILAQCLGTSLWFSPAGAANGLIARWQLSGAQFSWLLAATQLGFIAGSFALAMTGAADRRSSSRVFACSCLMGALANAALTLPGMGFGPAWWLRVLVGISLAGIYPLGMKLVVQWMGGKPALALAWLVAMLTLGTATPHALRAIGLAWPWEAVLLGASLLALAGGALVALVGDGRARPPISQPLRLNARDLRALWDLPRLRAAACGYFGHMWELYAFWAVVPALCLTIAASPANPAPALWSGWLAATVIGAGALGCIVGGYLARRMGSARVACAALGGSGLICLVYPLLPESMSGLRLAALLLWGVLVVADSPQFSALSAQAAPPQLLGLALVLQNGIGFLISVISIVLLSALMDFWGARALWLLAPGPLLGLWAMRGQLGRSRPCFNKED
ncbi:MFS transporter [Bordetella trematum]|uniref:MFS transporter n=1 Tax=Bordetella trematum TaxID=123899 RepID=UPI0021AFBE2D|nr:MFS transporter [Bordetella trematum]